MGGAAFHRYCELTNSLLLPRSVLSPPCRAHGGSECRIFKENMYIYESRSSRFEFEPPSLEPSHAITNQRRISSHSRGSGAGSFVLFVDKTARTTGEMCQATDTTLHVLSDYV